MEMIGKIRSEQNKKESSKASRVAYLQKRDRGKRSQRRTLEKKKNWKGS